MKRIVFAKIRLSIRVMAFLLVASLSLMIVGCVYDPFYYGPPPHAHYYPDYYDYYFYPSARVYFHFTTGFYFYWVDGRWVRTRVLPPHIRLGLYDRVKIKVLGEKPYAKFDEHIKIYKPVPPASIKKDKSDKERDANTRWFKEFEKRKDAPLKKPLKDKKDLKDKRMPHKM